MSDPGDRIRYTADLGEDEARRAFERAPELGGVGCSDSVEQAFNASFGGVAGDKDNDPDTPAFEALAGKYPELTRWPGYTRKA